MGSAIRTILCATDLSAASQAALACAVMLSRRCDARLLVLHAIDFPGEALSELAPQEVQALKTARLDLARNEIDDLLRHSAVSAIPLVDRGHPAQALLRTAREAHIDLLILTSYGITGIRRFFCDTVVERLITELPCPLLVLRHPATAGALSAPWRPQRMVLGVDMEACPTSLVRFGQTLAGAFDAALHLLYAVETPGRVEMEDGEALSCENSQRLFLNQQQARLTQWATQTGACPPAAQVAVRTGPPADAIQQYARECAADLLVVGIRPHHGMARLLPGPTARSLLRRSRRCLAVVPPVSADTQGQP